MLPEELPHILTYSCIAFEWTDKYLYHLPLPLLADWRMNPIKFNQKGIFPSLNHKISISSRYTIFIIQKYTKLTSKDSLVGVELYEIITCSECKVFAFNNKNIIQKIICIFENSFVLMHDCKFQSIVCLLKQLFIF